MGRWIGLVAACYLLGSVSFSYLIVRLLKRQDVRRVGSGNAGATNVLRTAGAWPALVALILDLGKGAAAVTAARLMSAPLAVVGGAAVAVVLGHVFPLFFGLRGGKGVATAVGALGPLAPVAAAASIALFALVVALSRYVSVGSITAALSFPLLWAAEGLLAGDPTPPVLLAAATLVAALVVTMHRPNLRRLAAGREHRLGGPRARLGEDR